MKVSFESKGDFDVVRAWLKKVTTNDPSVSLRRLADEGVRSLAASTPRATGETASGWMANVSAKGIVWKNKSHPGSTANVAKLIEYGHGTRTGGYVPPRPYIKGAMAPVWDSVDDKVIKELIK